jgi:hypothetical protein
MSASLAAFIIKLRELPFLCSAPAVASWETLAAVLVAFLNNAPVTFATLEEIKRGKQSPLAAHGYFILQRRDADALARNGRAPRAIAEASYLFVLTGCFKPRWRRKLESSCRRPIFPLWGLPEIGPVVAPHPSWLPIHGHGLPLVNVSLVPIDPASGKVSIVPWELLEHAEVGVEALSTMIGYGAPARNAGVRVGTVLRTRQLASMDHVGVVVLHESEDGQRAAGDN